MSEKSQIEQITGLLSVILGFVVIILPLLLLNVTGQSVVCNSVCNPGTITASDVQLIGIGAITIGVVLLLASRKGSLLR